MFESEVGLTAYNIIRAARDRRRSVCQIVLRNLVQRTRLRRRQVERHILYIIGRTGNGIVVIWIVGI